jgi:hypothetical protein
MKINFIRHRKQTPLPLQRRAANYVEGNDQPLALGFLVFAKKDGLMFAADQFFCHLPSAANNLVGFS